MPTHEYQSRPVFFDFETQSAADLKEVGGRIYAMCPSTRILSLSALIDRELIVWIPKGIANEYRGTPHIPEEYKHYYDNLMVYQSAELPQPITDAVNAGRTFAAHNAMGFDYFIWQNCITNKGNGPMPARWADTLYLARLGGMPAANLDAVAKRILGTAKDDAKKIVMPLTRGWWEDGVACYPPVLSGQIDPLIRYCTVDTLLLSAIWMAFDDLPVETDAIQAHQDINDRGIAVDLNLATLLSLVGKEASRRAGEEIRQLTNGELYGDTATEKGNLRSVDKVHAWLKKQGVEIAMEVVGEEGRVKKRTLRKDVVEQYLANPLLMLDADTEVTLHTLKHFNGSVLPLVSRVLRLRAAATRITAAKVDRIGIRSVNGRLYDHHTYHKARTGRASSQGVQIHNLPRGKKGVDVAALLDMYESGAFGTDAGEIYDKIAAVIPSTCTVDDALSSLIRPCFQAREGHTLGIADYAAIECRGIAWIAGEEKILDVFAAGRDIYCEFASILYGRCITKEHKEERQLGKICILGLGYGMGVEKFALTASLQGVDLRKAGISPDKCVETYRAAYQKIAGHYTGSFNGRTMRRGGIWDQLNTAAMKAVVEGGVHEAGKCRFVYSDSILRVRLPSGRELRYWNCRVEDRVPSFAASLNIDVKARPTIAYDGDRGETTMYGGKWAENCLSGSTKVVTSNGVKTLDTVTLVDKLWDGESWVSHDGLICNGEQEVIEWKGIQLTADHLMHDGNLWCESKNAGQEPWQFLKLGVYSEILRYLWGEVEKANVAHAFAIAGLSAKSTPGDLCGMKSVSALPADGEKLTLVERIQRRISYLIRTYGLCGAIDIQAWYHDALSLLVKRIRTMGGGELQSIPNGSSTETSSCGTPSLSPGGMNSDWIWTEKTTTVIMYLEIFDWLSGQLTPVTNVIQFTSNVQRENLHYLNSMKNSALSGNHGAPSTITYRMVNPPTKSSHCIVYDIQNSGLNSRFTVISDGGEVIVHNCVQAICRDILYTAMIRCERLGLNTVATVHDETVNEHPIADAEHRLRLQCAAMSEPPPWAVGFPIAVEGYLARRYVKEAAKGSYQVHALNGIIL